ncbi:Diphthamide biosynthesis protein 2 [Rhodotorula kratochvilovae]
MSQAPPSVAPSGEEAIHKHIDADPQALTDLDDVPLRDAYEVDLTLQEIDTGGYQRIALQFADEQLHDAVPVFRAIRERLPPHKELYVLADTTYGSCCVDEVAAQHVDADFVVHYGHTCLSPTARLPVLYILTKRSIDVDDAARALASTSRDALAAEPAKAAVLLYDVAYAHKAHLLADALRPLLPSSTPLLLSHLDSRANLHSHAPGAHSAPAPTPSSPKGKARSSSSPSDEPAPEPAGFDLDPSVPAPPTTVPRAAARYDLPAGVARDDCVLYWIGPESLALSNTLLTHGRCRVWSYDPTTRQARIESGRTNRMLMRRYATVEKAKDADVIGILVGTLGVAAYLPLITHLRALIAAHDKKSYTVAVGKLNPAKLANFIEVECFVLVACPENSMVDSKEFLRPIVTPFELELALTSKAWTGDYILDFAALLESSSFGQDAARSSSSAGEEEGEDAGSDGEAPVFSATTGTYRHPKRYTQKGIKDADDLAAQASALAIRDQSSAVARVLGSAAGEYLSTRSYKGLDPRYGQDAPAVLEMGREGGIARGYGYEKGAEGADAEGEEQ